MMQKPPGIEDIFPDKIDRWNFVINTARDVFRQFNYKEIIIPVMEYTDVFSRGLGDETDIVSKEMFTFEDRGGRSLTLRPEGTASVVRAYVENGEYNRLSTAKFYYIGPMFRAERPQRGRLRQFNQFGGELFGGLDPFYDFEVLSMVNSISSRLGIGSYTLLVNSIGCTSCRGIYLNELKKYYLGNQDVLCEDCKKRLEKNTLRLLDCKNEMCRKLRHDAPKISQYLDEDCREHFTSVRRYLDNEKISYKEDPFLVRGLDYYSRTTFEFVTDKLGGQNAFAAGGRYDQLVQQFGGNPTPAIGFAAGIERILLLLEDSDISSQGIDAYIVHTGGDTLAKAVACASLLRKNGLSSEIDPVTKGFKAQFKKADREKACFAIVIGEDELSAGKYTVKRLATGEQVQLNLEEVIRYISSK